MSIPVSQGAKFRAAVREERPLQVVGAINAYAARLAERTGFKALYLSGGGVAASSLGVPDLGISTMDDVLTDLRRRKEGMPVLVEKFRANLNSRFPSKQQKAILDVSLDWARLEEMPVNEYVDMFVI